MVATGSMLLKYVRWQYRAAWEFRQIQLLTEDRNRLAHIDEPLHRIKEKLPANNSDRSTSAAGTLLRGGLE